MTPFEKEDAGNGYQYEIYDTADGFTVFVTSRFSDECYHLQSAQALRAKIAEVKAREPIGYCLRLMRIVDLLEEIEEEICLRPDIYQLLERVRDAIGSTYTAARHAETLDRVMAD